MSMSKENHICSQRLTHAQNRVPLGMVPPLPLPEWTMVHASRMAVSHSAGSMMWYSGPRRRTALYVPCWPTSSGRHESVVASPCRMSAGRSCSRSGAAHMRARMSRPGWVDVGEVIVCLRTASASEYGPARVQHKHRVPQSVLAVPLAISVGHGSE